MSKIRKKSKARKVVEVFKDIGGISQFFDGRGIFKPGECVDDVLHTWKRVYARTTRVVKK